MQKRQWFKVIVGVTAILMLLSACAGSGGGATTAAATTAATTTASTTPAKEPPYEFTVAWQRGFTQADSVIQKYFEEKYNLKINIIVLPGGQDLQPRINLLMLDETQRPDLFWWTTGNMMKEYTQWRDAGLLVDVADYYFKYPNIREYYENTSPDSIFFRAESDGRMFAVPGDVGEPGHMVTLMRKDWLDKVGLGVPTTFDEYIDALRAFKEGNPGGGAGHYPFAGPMEYRSLKPFLSYFGAVPDQWLILPDGSIGYGAVQPETREALDFISKLYAEGIIDPDIVTRDLNFDEKFVAGTFGSCYRWIAYFNPSGNAAIAFKENNPDGEYTYVWQFPNGKGTESEHYYPPQDWCAFSITRMAKDPERIYAFIDALCGPEDYLIRRYGFEGEHYKYENGIMTRLLTEDDNLAKNIGRNIFSDLSPSRKDALNISNIPSVNEMFKHASTVGVKNDKERIAYIKTPDRPIWNENRAELERLRDEYLWGIIAGQRPLSAFDEFVELFKSGGGDKATAETTELYAKQAQDYIDFKNNFKPK